MYPQIIVATIAAARMAIGSLGGWYGLGMASASVLLGTAALMLMPGSLLAFTIASLVGAAAWEAGWFLTNPWVNSFPTFEKARAFVFDTVNDFFKDARNFVPMGDPLVLDLDGDGKISTVGISANKAVLFDHDGDGIKTGTGWVLGNDGFLVIDKNGNDVIDNGTELFGTGYVKQDGSLALSGLDAMADLDSNGDGVFDENDAAFSQVKVWRDVNQDGISQADELATLAELGIASINLAATNQNQNLGNGNVQTATTTYTRTDGTTGTAANLELVENAFYREFVEKISLSKENNLLPNMQGSGVMRDLREAAELSPTLAQDLQALADAGIMDRVQYLNLVENILQKWIDTARPNMTSSWEAAEEAGMSLYFVPGGLSRAEQEWVYKYYCGAWIGAGYGSSTGALVVLDEATLARRAQILEQIERIEKLIWLLEPVNGLQFVTIDEKGNGIKDGNGSQVSAISLSASDNPSTVARMQALPRQVFAEISAANLALLEKSYQALLDSVAQGLLLQTRLKPYLDAVTLVIDETGFHLDWSGMFALFEQTWEGSHTRGIADLVDFLKHPAVADFGEEAANEACFREAA